MTISSLHNQIIGNFLEKDIFTVADFSKIKIPDELLEKKEEFIRAALKILEDGNMLRQIGGDTWVLVAPLNAEGQEVHLSMATCHEIAETLNMYLEAQDVEERVSALEIHEGHIMHLIQIIAEYLSKE